MRIAEKLYRLFFPFLTCCSCARQAVCTDECLCPACAQELAEVSLRMFIRSGHEVWVCAPYTGAAAGMVRRLKFHADREAGRIIGKFCIKAYRSIGRTYDLIAPAPLSRKRLRIRGFNQCVLFGKMISNACGVPLQPRALYRVRDVKSQHELGWRERFENADHAFAAREALVRGKTVLFLDDVFTSGATSDDCVRALLQAGAARVMCCVLRWRSRPTPARAACCVKRTSHKGLKMQL
jgi:ComF family protein